MRRGHVEIAIALVLAACTPAEEPVRWTSTDAEPPEAEPPPVPPPPPVVEDAAAPVAPVTTAPPPEMPPFDRGYLERHDQYCWMSNALPEPCSGREDCKPAIWTRVTCPPTLAKHDKAPKKGKATKTLPAPPKGGYLEKVVATGRCFHAPKRPVCTDGAAKCNLASIEVRCP